MPPCKRIMLVDDEKRISETFSMLLSEHGYYVRTASTPEAALQLLSDDSFDIVFLDQFLGRITGLDLMQRMSEITPGLYYIIITGHGNTDLAVEALKRGASDFITKPFFTADLLKSIEFIEKKRELDDEKKMMLATLEQTVNKKTEELRSVYFSVLSSLAQAMEKRDIGTYGHSKRVSKYSKLIADSLYLNAADKNDLEAAALLHDIGKIGISDFILGKEGPLDLNETTAVRRHPQKGVEILKPIKQFRAILPAILHHHENYDGSGYPHGLSGENIPLNARIIAVADTYDAILSNRPYRFAASHNAAAKELTFHAGKQFDPVVVNAFLNADIGSMDMFNIA